MWRARLIALASSRCFLAETAVMRAGDDLAALGDEALEQADVLVVDRRERPCPRRGSSCGGGKMGGPSVNPHLFVARAKLGDGHRGRGGRRGRDVAAGTTVAAVAAVVAVALARSAHHRRRTFFMLIDADGHVADDVFVDVGLALELGDDAGGASMSSSDVMRLAVLGDAVGEAAQAPGLGLDDLAAIVGR